ncbi:amidase family protein [Microbulbifer sp. CnH-101-G]|uniref:amidase family protein n=1 Tax=Microbulbifer sp. CnH-101-G TaxID=3243393 RepID=UPI00403A1772
MTQSILQLAEKIRAGQLTSTVLIEESLGKARADENLHAFISLDKEKALAAAQYIDRLVAEGAPLGPLSGIPLAVKDNINVKGMHTTAGTPGIDFIASHSAPVVRSLIDANAIIVGKANMHELAFGVTSNNAAFGAVRNPMDLTCFPGGSSGGTAAAIAAGIVPAGLGTDTAGSVRLPAALTGIVGFRPTTHDLSQAGVVPSVPTFDVVGPMARTVEDVTYLFAIMKKTPMPNRKELKGLHFAVAYPHSADLSPRVKSAFQLAQERLKRAGLTLTELDLTELVDSAFDIGYPIAYHQMKSAMIAFLQKYQPDTSLEQLIDCIASADVKEIYQESVIGRSAPTDEQYKHALSKLPKVQQKYLDVIKRKGIDAIIFPTASIEAQPIATSSLSININGMSVPTLQVYERNIAATAVWGAPGLSIPLESTTTGLPIGLELDGLPGEDLDLLAIGMAVEAICSPKAV